MSQITNFNTGSTGTVTSVSGGVGINITGVPTINPTVNLDIPVTIAHGGTNSTTFTSNAVVYFDGVQLVNITNGASGTVLTSTGVATVPAFSAVPGITITGTAGSPLTGNSFTFSGGSSGAVYTGAGTTMTTSFAGLLANGGNINLSTDAVAGNVNIGTGSDSKQVIIGSTAIGSTTSVRTGNGSLAISTTGGGLDISSATGALNISNDASNTVVKLGTGAAIKTVTVGSATSSSRTDILSGSGNVFLNGGFKVTAGGINTNPVQPAFRAYASSDANNATGDGTIVLAPFDSAILNQGNYYDSSIGVYTFTAPVTGVYMLGCSIYIDTIAITNNVMVIDIVTTGQTYSTYCNPFYEQAVTGPGPLVKTQSVLTSMSAGNTAFVQVTVSGGTKTVNVKAGSGLGYFWGYLAC